MIVSFAVLLGRAPLVGDFVDVPEPDEHATNTSMQARVANLLASMRNTISAKVRDVLNTVAYRFYGLTEPLSTAPFFSPETQQAFAEIGLDGDAGYVMSRAAPMGSVTAAAVAAAFYSFHVDMVGANLHWDVADPQRVIETRTRAAGATMHRLLADVADADLERARVLLERVARSAPTHGRPLAAAHATLPWPDDDATALWHAATILREHRGDGHVAVLLTHGITPAEALVLDGALNALKKPKYFAYRQFGEQATTRAREALQHRGYLDANGALTDGGGKFRQMLEMETDRLASPPYETLDEDERNELERLLAPMAARIAEQRAVPRFVAALSGNPVTS